MTTYPICSSGAHCSFCRAIENHSFRKSLSDANLIPSIAVDSDCPFGKGPLLPKELVRIENKQTVSTFVGTVGQRNNSVPKASTEESSRRQSICNSCDEFNGNVCERVFECGVCLAKWFKFLSSLDSKCPLNKW